VRPEQLRAKLAAWRMTAHALDQMAERGIAPSELMGALVAPDRTSTMGVFGQVSWAGRVGAAWRPDIDRETGARVKVITTVYIDKSDAFTWADHVVEEAGARQAALSAEQLTTLLGVPEPARFITPSAKFRPEKRSGPVKVTSVYDGIPASMLAAAKQALRDAGLDPGDLSRIRRVPGKIALEVDTDRRRR